MLVLKIKYSIEKLKKNSQDPIQYKRENVRKMSRKWIFVCAAVVVIVHFSIIIFMLSPLYSKKAFYGSSYVHLGLRQSSVSWCKELRLQKPPSHKVVALVSYPGSGNTWLRYLLQQATGIMTGSIYMDYGLRVHGFPAENITNGSVLVVKTHEGPPPDKKYQAAVLLIRNPRDAILRCIIHEALTLNTHAQHLNDILRQTSTEFTKATLGQHLNQPLKRRLETVSLIGNHMCLQS